MPPARAPLDYDYGLVYLQLGQHHLNFKRRLFKKKERNHPTLPCGGWVGTPGRICRFHLSAGRSSPAPSWTAPSRWDCTQKTTLRPRAGFNRGHLRRTNAPVVSHVAAALLDIHFWSDIPGNQYENLLPQFNSWLTRRRKKHAIKS